jgi:hypothetical protein
VQRFGAVTLTARFSAALAALHWGPRSFSMIAGVHERTVYRWMHEIGEPPDALVMWLEGIAAYVRDHPAPQPRSQTRL